MRRLFLLSTMVLIAACATAADAVRLTDGPGNDTEAAWSPDGKRIAFQTDRDGDLDLYILDLASGTQTPLVKGPGHACFPSWSPDGKWIAYAYAHFTKTAFDNNENGYNLFVVPSTGGEPRRLTQGLFRDYTPVFSRDGQTIYFSAARHPKTNAVSIFSIPLAGGEATPVIPLEGKDEAAVQPDFSADGRLLAYGYVKGFRDNWTLRLAKTANPTDAYPLTDSRSCFYGPRWSPADAAIACTGYEVGDPGWNVWLVRLSPLQRLRVTALPGNSRSPAWSPDGKEIVFENSQTGSYKLYRMAAPQAPAAPAVAFTIDESKGAVLRLDFSTNPDDAIRDLSEIKNDPQAHGGASWADGAMQLNGKDGWLAIEKPRGFDFGQGAFTVKATVSVPSHTNEVRIICVGDYPKSRNGWQIYIGKDNKAWFNSRTPDGTYRGAMSEQEMPVGRAVTLVGERLPSGVVRMFVDGALQPRTSADATLSYPAPSQVRIGSQWNGDSPFNGRIHDIVVYNRELTPEEIRGRSLEVFLKGALPR